VAFHAGGCASCHATPNQDDKLRLGGGYALHSPFGTFYVPNLSPHPRDGIGGWTDAQFLRAMKAGVSPDGRHYYPSFPYTSYQRMTAEDARDLLAYIKTLEPVEGRARDHDLPFPFNVRRGLGLWTLAFLDGETFRPDPARSAAVNRGAYLTQGLGHCAECHSGRTALGNIAEERRYAGGPNPEGRGWVPNITPHETGLKPDALGRLGGLHHDGGGEEHRRTPGGRPPRHCRVPAVVAPEGGPQGAAIGLAAERVAAGPFRCHPRPEAACPP
jgi:mono/diheme cytochrome c family protein